MKQFIPYAGGMLGLLVFSAPGMSADFEPPAEDQLCAVSALNGKVAGGGGYYEDPANNDDALGFGEASISIPLGCQFGLQVDGAGGSLGGDGAGGVAGHLFTRDPRSYLLGAFGSYSNINGIDIGRVGGEGQLYLDRISLEGIVGYEDSDVLSSDVFVDAKVAYYLTDNLRLAGGFRRFLTIDAAVFSLEWQPEELNLGVPVSLFVEGQFEVDNGRFGLNNYNAVFGGVRVYFAEEQKTLIRRHREDDPFNSIINLLANVCAGAFPVFSTPVQDGVVNEGIIFEGTATEGNTPPPTKMPPPKISSFVDSCGDPVAVGPPIPPPPFPGL